MTKTPWRHRHRSMVELTLFGLGLFVYYCLMHENDSADRLFVATLLAAFALLFAFLTRRFWFSLAASTALFALIWISGFLKFSYLEVPAIAPDLYYFMNLDTARVIARYPFLLASVLATVLGIPALLWLAWRSDESRMFPHDLPRRRRGIQVAGALGSALMVGLLLWNKGPHAQVYGKPMWVAVTDESFITNFVISFYDTQIEMPEDMAGADDSIDWRTPSREEAPAPAVRPDVIMILEESTFDPAILKVCKGVALCKRQMFTPDARTVANGLMGAHTFGGGTWTAEFSLITGLNHAEFGNAGLYAPYNLAPRMRPTIARDFKAAGYRVVALYPTAAEFINGRNAYAAYGFDMLHDGPELGLEWHSNDNDIFELFWKLYQDDKRAHPDQPTLFFMMTIHQHGPHMTPYNEMAPPYDKPLFGAELGDWLSLNLTNYLERNARSDVALRQLERRLFEREQPTVLMHFGDHQPSFDGAMWNLEKVLPPDWGQNHQWATYYMLKANFPVAQKYDYPILDLVYLGALVEEVAGVKKDEYFVANTLMRERCRGRYLECADRSMLPSYHRYVFETLKVLEE
jgi:phosphoglycerol transferase MdoB-like AlkP superfamily enzyme